MCVSMYVWEGMHPYTYLWTYVCTHTLMSHWRCTFSSFLLRGPSARHTLNHLLRDAASTRHIVRKWLRGRRVDAAHSESFAQGCRVDAAHSQLFAQGVPRRRGTLWFMSHRPAVSVINCASHTCSSAGAGPSSNEIIRIVFAVTS